MQIQGYFDVRFETVRDEFEQLFTRKNPQRGGALCVKVGGETVLDLWAGQRDATENAVWETDTLVNVFSCTKAFTSVAMLQFVEEGKIALDDPVANVWPEFAAAGKEWITLRELLCHRAGLPAISQPLPESALYNWSELTQALANQQPWWEPGTEQGYAAITFGWLLGELIQRLDNLPAGEAIMRRTAQVAGADFYLGVPEDQDHRVARLERGRNDFGDAAAQRLLKAFTQEPDSITAQAFNNPPGIMQSAGKAEWRRHAQPAANGHTNARGLADFYEALRIGRLLSDELLREALTEHSCEDDLTLLTRTRFGLGLWLDQPTVENATFAMGAQSYGHPGAGGSIGFVDPEREVSFGFVTNTLGPYVLMDPRAQGLAKAVAECL